MNIIFIPGLLCTHEVWGQTNTLRDKHTCYDANVIDFSSIEDMSDNLLKHLPSNDVVLIGISMGGYVAIDAAIKAKDKIKKLILINATANSVDPATITERKKAIKFAMQGRLMDILAMSNGICYFNPKKEWILLEKEMGKKIGTQGYINQQTAILNRKNYTSELENITADTLIISGKADKIIPTKDAIDMCDKIKKSSLFLLSECGHLATLEKSDVVANIIEKFIEKNDVIS